MTGARSASSIDRLMDQASSALAAADYFGSQAKCERAAASARRVNDFERLARICMPWQEARRQIRQLAEDAGMVAMVPRVDEYSAGAIAPGCYLVCPPAIAIDAHELRDHARKKKTPVYVLTREPMTRAGMWPIAAIRSGGELLTRAIRVQRQAPAGVRHREGVPTHDDSSGPPPIQWFLEAGEALGDAAIAALKPDEPAAWRVDDLLEAIEAIPEHEKLFQALQSECFEAAKQPVPDTPRRRPVVDDPTGF